MARKKDIEMGDIVEDQLTKLRGVAAAFGQSMTGQLQVAIVPANAKGSTEVKNFFVDITQAKYVGKGPVAPLPLEETGLTLGGIAEDVVTGVQGVLTECITHLGGCTQYMLIRKVNPDGKIPPPLQLDWRRFKMIDATVQMAAPAKAAADAPAKKPPGGPAREMASRYL